MSSCGSHEPVDERGDIGLTSSLPTEPTELTDPELALLLLVVVVLTAVQNCFTVDSALAMLHGTPLPVPANRGASVAVEEPCSPPLRSIADGLLLAGFLLPDAPAPDGPWCWWPLLEVRFNSSGSPILGSPGVGLRSDCSPPSAALAGLMRDESLLKSSGGLCRVGGARRSSGTSWPTDSSLSSLQQLIRSFSSSSAGSLGLSCGASGGVADDFLDSGGTASPSKPPAAPAPGSIRLALARATPAFSGSGIRASCK
uniref:Uncharacterized protein n=1 Tax=Anopheles coluzzii TaxID=1518534 RepID=A0A8W7PFM3_ANOCL